MLKGLVLAGGQSSRMGTDKGLLILDGQTLRDRARGLLAEFCGEVFVSIRADQECAHPSLEDRGGGPGAALRAAYAHDPQAAWLVVACDLPGVTRGALAQLIAAEGDVVCFREADGTPQPLLALWRPRALTEVSESGGPRAALERVHATIIDPSDPRWLRNVNTAEEWRLFKESAAGTR